MQELAKSKPGTLVIAYNAVRRGAPDSVQYIRLVAGSECHSINDLVIPAKPEISVVFFPLLVTSYRWSH